jgi:4-amino-4-deoxy-L-arabinose transferase-like glycosyltransferase
MQRRIPASEFQYSQRMPDERQLLQTKSAWLGLAPGLPLGLAGALLVVWCIGLFGRGYWTPDEPREADIAWRMSWQADKAVPLLAGEPFCEKPPLTYWLAAAPISLFGPSAWAARLPNLLYALITALSLGLLARRCAGQLAGYVAAAAVSTFLLGYQVAIWLATDAPLLAAVSVSLLGAHIGFYAVDRPQRLRGYLLMHAALALGFLSKSAVAWMVPSLALLTLSIWERRWRELFRWELYIGLALQAVVILSWVYFVYTGPQGLEHLKVFFWNNLVGRFTAVDAPAQIQYAAGHKNSPGKYLIELPLYLFPWTFAVIAASRRAWRERRNLGDQGRTLRFAIACSLPSLLILSLAATARNIYLAPALPGVALLLAWWAREIVRQPGKWDVRALKLTAAMLLLGVLVFVAVLYLLAADEWQRMAHGSFVVTCVVGLPLAGWLAAQAWSNARDHAARSLTALFLAYCVLLAGPCSQVYRQIDGWQDLSGINRAIRRDAAGSPLILLTPDETTLAAFDLSAAGTAARDSTPLVAASIERARQMAGADGAILVQLPKRPLAILEHFRKAPAGGPDSLPAWIAAANLHLWKEYAVPNGRRYGLLKSSS